jgi:hypothetical protein
MIRWVLGQLARFWDRTAGGAGFGAKPYLLKTKAVFKDCHFGGPTVMCSLLKVQLNPGIQLAGAACFPDVPFIRLVYHGS